MEGTGRLERFFFFGGGFVQWNLGYLFFFRFPLLVSPVFFDKFFQHCWWKKLGASINTTCWFSHSEMIWIWFNSRLSRIWMVGGSFHPDTKTLGKMKPFWRVVFFKWVGWFNHQLGSADRGWVPRNECSQGKMALPYVLLRTVDSSQGLGVKIIGYSDWYWYWISVFLYRYNAHFSQKRNFVLLLDSISVLPSRTSVPQDRGIHLRLHHYCHRKEAEAWVVYPANVEPWTGRPREDVGSCKFIKWSPGRCGIKQIAQFIWVFARRNGWGTLGNSPISSPGGSASLPLKTIWAMNRSSPTKKGGQIPSSGSGVESVCDEKISKLLALGSFLCIRITGSPKWTQIIRNLTNILRSLKDPHFEPCFWIHAAATFSGRFMVQSPTGISGSSPLILAQLLEPLVALPNKLWTRLAAKLFCLGWVSKYCKSWSKQLGKLGSR